MYLFTIPFGVDFTFVFFYYILFLYVRKYA